MRRQVAASSNSGLHQASTVSICGCSPQRLRRQLPHLGEGRIEQLRAAVAAEHRDRFGEVVERFALNPDQAVESPRQIEAFGDVVEQIGDAAFRIGRGDDAERAAIGQVPGVLFRLDRAIGLMQLGLPGAEIRLLRQFARGAQPVEHAGIVGIAVEEGAVEVPQPAIGIVVEGKPPLAVEHRDAGRQLVEGAAMRLRHPHQRRAAARWLRWRRSRCRRCRRRPAGAARHRCAARRRPRSAAARRRPALSLQRALHLAAVAAVEQFEVAVDGVRDAGGFGCPRIGGVGIAAARHWRAWPRSARVRRRRSRAASRSLRSSALCRRLVSASSRRRPQSSRIRTMAWPPMARPIASKARPFDVVRLSRKPSPASRNASTA